MQTRKKISAGKTALDVSSPKFCRNQRENVAGKQVTELITSSARKQKSARIIPKRSKDAEAAKIASTRFVNAADDSSLDHKQGNKKDAHYMVGTIFSPNFHVTKDVGGGFCESGFINVLEGRVHEDLKFGGSNNTEITMEPSVCNGHDRVCVAEVNVNSSCHGEEKGFDNSTHNSRLECVEPCQDYLPTEDCMDVDEDDEFDDFDPYLFISNLPDLSTVVPTFRHMLLPKQTRSCPSTTLVLDLDETLVHSSLEYCEGVDFTFPVSFNQKEHVVYVRRRPFLKDFLERVSNLFEVVIFTASQRIYGERLLNMLDPKRKLFRHRIYRDSCVFVDGNYLKDLSVLGRDLARVIIIDNSPQAFGFQIDNGIPIESWFDDKSDCELLSLIPFLQNLVGIDDVRPLIAKQFNLRGRISAANFSSLSFFS
ncbi:CTD small phosphatase-like protein [Zostera marina]|uniref:CTD small phosphatase-like protein n=1 Tax=Zostera marina TaxID=29655 RepID=A0A0K9Q658_ZOSMR|nr:CTD small phosphatase-like protein [Zostera marina]